MGCCAAVCVQQYAKLTKGPQRTHEQDLDSLKYAYLLRREVQLHPASAVLHLIHMPHYCELEGEGACGLVSDSDAEGGFRWQHMTHAQDLERYLLNDSFGCTDGSANGIVC